MKKWIEEEGILTCIEMLLNDGYRCGLRLDMQRFFSYFTVLFSLKNILIHIHQLSLGCISMSSSINVKDVEALIDNLVRKGIAYTVALYPFLYSSDEDSISIQLELLSLHLAGILLRGFILNSQQCLRMLICGLSSLLKAGKQL